MDRDMYETTLKLLAKGKIPEYAVEEVVKRLMAEHDGALAARDLYQAGNKRLVEELEKDGFVAMVEGTYLEGDNIRLMKENKALREQLRWRSAGEFPDEDGREHEIITASLAIKSEFYHFMDGWATDETVIFWRPITWPEVK